MRDTDYTPAAWIGGAAEKAEWASLMAMRRDAALPRHSCLFAGAAARFAVRALLVATETSTRESDDLPELVGLIPYELGPIKNHPAVPVLERYGPDIGDPDRGIPGLTWDDADLAANSAEELVSAIRSELTARGIDVTTPERPKPELTGE
jgi:hypothetical protein